MTSPPLTSTRSELLRALGAMAEPPGREHIRLAEPLGLPAPNASEWTEAFVVQLVPHASIYLGNEGMLGGEAADRIAGFWRALRRPVPADADHLTALLGLYATVIEAALGEPDPARRALWAQARLTLLNEHLLTWLPIYTEAMMDVGPEGYVEWARLLRDTLLAEAAEVGALDVLPSHLRHAAPGLPSGPTFSTAGQVPDRLAAVLDVLLAPVRSGIVVTRGHLRSGAARVGLGARLGDRRRMLHGLIEQDPPAMLGWLADQAAAWVDRHRRYAAATGSIAAYWAGRATTTATGLRAAQYEIRHLPVHPPIAKERDR